MPRTALILVLSLLPAIAVAQGRDTTLNHGALPLDVTREAVRLYNANGTLRSTGALDIGAGQTVNGDVAVLNGPVTIAGRVNGNVLAINGDVRLAPTAHVEGNLLVVGGDVRGRNDGYVGGEIRIYREQLQYTQEGDHIAAETAGDENEPWWRRFEEHRDKNGSRLTIASAGAYNRVEGLPIDLGPQLFHNFQNGSARLDAYGVFRTASSFRANNNDVGHNLRGELRFGANKGFLIGAGSYNVVTPVESWGLSNLETGLAAGLFRRDYRDYYQRHGGALEAGLFSGSQATFRMSYADEHWTPLVDHDAWTLFRSNAEWRPNPALDDAHLHLLDATLNVDTRSDESNPWSGWYVLANLEYGTGTLDTFGATSVARAYSASGATSYDRAFVDVRRYNRVSRHAQLNLRVVAGGWVGGDPLPLERRLSVDGYDGLPGFEFRGGRAGSADVSTCASAGAPIPAGYPAQCDRIALAQAEYRSDLHVHLFGWDDDDWVRPHFTADGAWVVFLDAGRGWLVGEGASPMSYGSGALPSLSSFRTDAGVGLDFNSVGVYVAKALSNAGESARVFIRLQHRF
ncbi:MAG TPA: BamA/TamA family outer membrane protein [Gemmatimonadaceae bacterium]